MISTDSLGPLLLDTAARGTLVLLAALAATSLMRGASASARHLVWLAALAALLVLPLARQGVPEWRVLPGAPAALSSGLAPQAAGAEGPSAALPRDETAGVAGAAPIRTPAARPVDGPRAVLLLWAVVSGLLLLRLAWGALRVRRIERAAAELTDSEWVGLTDRLSRRLGLGRIVRLLRHRTARVPMTWGLLRPVVLLPEEADGWDAERRGVVLAHELAHVRRWDALTQWIAHLATALFWFHPLVWVAAHRLRQERERACDDAVLEIGTVPAAYADHLLTIVRALGRAPVPSGALAMARRSQFEGRLLAILDAAVRRNGVSRAAALAILAAAVACLVPLAALRPAEAAPIPAPPVVSIASAPDETAPAAPAVEPPSATRPVEPAPPVDAAAETPSNTAARQEVVEMLAAATRFASDTEKRRAVLRIFAHPGFRAASDVPLVLIDVLRGMRSPTEQRRVLTALWEVRQWDESCLVTFLEYAAGIPSDTERQRILRGAAANQRMGPDARRAFEAAGGAIRTQAPDASASAARQPGETKWDSDLVLETTRDGRPRTIRIRANDMFFRSARSTPHRIGPGGELYVEERRDGEVRVVHALPGPDGRPEYTYTVDGERRPFGADERGWMAAMIRELTGS